MILRILSFLFFLNFVSNLFGQLSHEIKLPITVFQKSNIYTGLNKHLYNKQNEIYYTNYTIPSIEYNIKWKSKYNIGVGYQFVEKGLYTPIPNMSPPDYTLRYMTFQYLYLKFGYFKTFNSFSIEANMIVAEYMNKSFVEFNCLKPFPWEGSSDTSNLSNYNAGMELGISKKLYKGLKIYVDYQYFLQQKFSRDNCLKTLPTTFKLNQVFLKIGYIF